jgi:hypothetical protein
VDNLFQLLIWWLWRPVDELAERYLVLVGIPLLLLPLFVIAGIIYLLAR